MLEDHLKIPVTRRRLRSGPAADHIDRFADWLDRQGYLPTSIVQLLRSLAAWTDWMDAAGFTGDDFLAGYEACRIVVSKEKRVLYSRGPNRASIIAARVFIRFLREQEVLSPAFRAPLVYGGDTPQKRTGFRILPWHSLPAKPL